MKQTAINDCSQTCVWMKSENQSKSLVCLRLLFTAYRWHLPNRSIQIWANTLRVSLTRLRAWICQKLWIARFLRDLVRRLSFKKVCFDAYTYTKWVFALIFPSPGVLRDADTKSLQAERPQNFSVYTAVSVDKHTWTLDTKPIQKVMNIEGTKGATSQHFLIRSNEIGESINLTTNATLPRMF